MSLEVFIQLFLVGCFVLIWRSYAPLMSRLSVYDVATRGWFLTTPRHPKSLAFNLARTQKEHLNLESIYPDFLCSKSFNPDKRTIRTELLSIMELTVAKTDSAHIKNNCASSEIDN